MLPPEQMAQAAQGGGMNPVNFLIAAADMHGQGQLSAPAGLKPNLGSAAKRPTRRLPDLKVIR